ncbi:MAG: hypothetical protein L6R37_004249 [Teloschistes peruensis]|nr:MAG: hypothetical protein L6R37_004249 [Teloschistes peruensis]
MHARSSGLGIKRARTDDPLPSQTNNTTTTTTVPATGSSSFRNVSACNRCRVRKNRCDQNLPACSLCEKAGARCVGFDPITKREIPRTYVYYLESRLNYLESLLADNGIAYAPCEEFHLGTNASSEPASSQPASVLSKSNSLPASSKKIHPVHHTQYPRFQEQDEEGKLNTLVSSISMVSVQGAADPRYLGSTSGISFARVVFAAIKSSVPNAASDKGSVANAKPAAAGSGPSMRDSFFGLHSRPTIEPAPLPDSELGLRLVNLYFEHANPQIPTLHKGEFMALFDRAYASAERHKSARELYMLNIVFAIGAGIILEDSHLGSSPVTGSVRPKFPETRPADPIRTSSSSQQHQPEEYHAAAMMHLESFLGSTSSADHPDGFGCGLEELQAVLLLAGFALLRPVAPGLFYIAGVATRLGVDLGLHYEEGTDLDALDQRQGQVLFEQNIRSEPADSVSTGADAVRRGRRQWMRDLRRRLWWCVYSFDRLVSTCVGRPFGITDLVITTDFPTLLDDEYITRSGFALPPESFSGPSYKHVSHHYFRLRLLQSEILEVLQFRQAQQAHASSSKPGHRYMHTKLCLSFLQPFESYQAWRQDIDRRLLEWKESAPLQRDTNVKFPVQFLELNYWQAVIMLYRQSLGALPKQAGHYSSSEDINSPTRFNVMEEGEDESVYLKVAEAGQRVLLLYRQLHRIHLVNYTFLATVHLFMAGDLISKCPPAEACRDAFERMSRATVKMCLSTTGFRSQATGAFGSLENAQALDRTWSQPKQRRSHRRGPESGSQGRHTSFDRGGEYQGTDMTSEQWLPPLQTSTTALPPPSSYRSLPEGSSTSQRSFGSFESTQSPSLQSLPPLPMENSFFDPSENTGLDFLMMNDDSTTYDGQFGMNLGFGEEHDWSDGVQLDLFDGFFFGAGNGNVGTNTT